MFKRNRGNEVIGNAISMFHGKDRTDWESRYTIEYGNTIYRLLSHNGVTPEGYPDLFKDMLPRTPEGEIEWVLACMEHDLMEYIKYANIQPPEKLQKIIDLINNGVYPKVSDIEAPVINNPEQILQQPSDEQTIVQEFIKEFIREFIKSIMEGSQLDENTIKKIINISKLSDALRQYLSAVPDLNSIKNVSKDDIISIISKDGVIKNELIKNEFIKAIKGSAESDSEQENDIIVVEDDLIKEYVKKSYKIRQKERNTDKNIIQTLILKHNDSNIKNLVSVTKKDKTVGITFTTDFLIVMAVNDYVAGCIPIILYARNFSVDIVYNRFLSTVRKMVAKGYNSRYFGGRILESHLMNGQLKSDYRYEAVQLAIKMNKIIKKDLKI